MTQAIQAIVDFFDRVGQTVSPTWFLVNQWLELGLVAMLFTAWCVLVLKFTGCTNLLHSARLDAVAGIYRMALYRTRPAIVLRATGQILIASVKSLLYLTPTIVLSAIAFGLMWNTLVNRYHYGPMEIGDSIVVEVVDNSQALTRLDDLNIPEVDGGLQLTATVNVPSKHTIWYRFISESEGLHKIRFDSTARPIAINVAADELSALRKTISAQVQVTIHYPERKWWGMTYGWLMWFLVICCAVSAPLVSGFRIKL